MSIEEKLNEVKRKITNVQTRKTRAEVQNEQAEAAKSAALEKLKATFKVDTIEKAEKLLGVLQEKLEVKLTEAETMLKEVD